MIEVGQGVIAYTTERLGVAIERLGYYIGEFGGTIDTDAGITLTMTERGHWRAEAKIRV